MRASSISCGKHDLPRDTGGFRVELLHELRHHFRIRSVLGAFEHKVLPADELPAPYEEDLYAGFSIRASHGQHIRIQIVGGKDDLLPFNNGLHGLQLIPESAQRARSASHRMPVPWLSVSAR